MAMPNNGEVERFCVNMYSKALQQQGVAAHYYNNCETDLKNSLEMLTNYNKFMMGFKLGLKKSKEQPMETSAE
jgi:hypothetical protein